MTSKYILELMSRILSSLVGSIFCHGLLAWLRVCQNFRPRVGTSYRRLSHPILALLILLFNSILISNIYISQMAHEKREKKRVATLDIDSSPSSDSEATGKHHWLFIAWQRERQLPRFLCALVVVGDQILKEFRVKAIALA
jgi:hypothetical protein